MPASPRLASLLPAALCVAALPVLFSAPASAQAPPLPVLRLEYGASIPPVVQAEVRDALAQGGSAGSGPVEVIDAAATRKKLLDASPALAGCESKECLKRSGEVLKATAGLAVEVQGEAQIYDMQIIVYNLTDGSTATSEKFSCDVCTAREVGEKFTTTLQAVLKRVQVKAPAQPEIKVAPPKEDPKPVKPALVEVQIQATPAEARIFLDDAPLGAGSAAVKLAPGDYQVRTEAPGFEPTRTTLIVKPDAPGPIKVELALSPVVAAQVTPPPPEPTPTPTPAPAASPERSTGRLIGGGVALGVGLGALGAGAWLLGLDGEATCAEGAINQCPNVYETSAGGTVLVAVGASSATAGLFLLLWDVLTGEPTPAAAPATTHHLRLHLAPDQVGVSGAW